MMKRYYKWLIFVILLLSAPAACAGDSILHGPASAEKIDRLLDDAISRGLVTGGVVLVGNRNSILLEKAYGRVSPLQDARPMTVDTIFDVASLTKVLATTPAVLKLAEEGKLHLVDPVAKWLPEFSGKGKDELLILNLLTHTSGLDDFSLSSTAPMQSAVEGAASQKIKGEIGHRFRYADINFILLGEIVRRASGLGLDQYVTTNFYQPMGMRDTAFNPGPELIPRCAPTLADRGLISGQVQDHLSRQLGGVAGHAGVFSTARDIGVFCRMMLNEGQNSGRAILAPRAVQQMTVPYFSRGGEVARGLGWDMASPFSSPKGHGFSELSFGHTGYSGSSIWIDPSADIFVVLVTSRLDYKNVKEFSRLRSELSSLAAERFTASQALVELMQSIITD